MRLGLGDIDSLHDDSIWSLKMVIHSIGRLCPTVKADCNVFSHDAAVDNAPLGLWV
jgi:hypothetical protein